MLEVSRKELKFIMQTDETALLQNRLAQIMDEDAHSGGSGYAVRSLYFDSFSNTDYNEKLAGTDHRKKIRMRIYDGSDSLIKLELKRKDGDFQRKSSLTLSRSEADSMLSCDYSFLSERPEPVAHGLYTLMSTQGYRPKIVVEYDRRAFRTDTNEIRITFDSGLRCWTDPEDFFEPMTEASPVTGPSETTMEVKYNGFLYFYIKNVLQTANRMRTSNSKYVRARNMLMI